MKKAAGVLLVFLSALFIGNIAFAHEAMYAIKQIGENTITVTLKADSNSGKGIEITSASKRGGKELNIFYRTDGTRSSDSLDVDLRTMLPPIRIVLTDISNPDKALFLDTKGIEQEIYIQHLHDKGAINGFPDGTFKPDKGVSRAEFVTMLLKALNINKKSTSQGFKDTAKHWAKDTINTAYDMKIIDGFGNGYFKPDNSITAAQASKIIDSLFKFRITKQTALPDLNQKHWANEAIKRIINAGIIMPDDKLYKEFKEDKPLSRADCAMMLSRAITTE